MVDEPARTHPMLGPGRRRIRRSGDTVQLGLDPGRAVLLTGVPAAFDAVLEALAGTDDQQTVVARASSRGVDSATTSRTLDLLAGSGLLEDGRGGVRALHGLPTAERERLRPDLTARAILRGTSDAGGLSLLRRRRSHVVVYGGARVGGPTACLLAAAGVGRVSVVDPTPARPADLAPGGLPPSALGAPRQDGIARAMAAAAPSSRTGTGEPSERPTLALLLPDADEVDRRLPAQLVRDDVPHLLARMREEVAILGPLVIPGVTSCVRCHDLYRTDRDPDWPLVLAQVLADPASGEACDVALATMLAAATALHALAFVEGERPPSCDGTVELRLPYGTARRRSWSAHPRCGCRWEHLEAAPRETLQV